MYELLDSIGLSGVVLFFTALIIVSIYIFRWYFNIISNKISRGKIASEAGHRKHCELDMRRYDYLFFNISLAITLGIVLAFLEFPSFEQEMASDLGVLELETEETLDIPPTQHEAPPPPKIEVIKIIEVDAQETIDEEIPDIVQEFDEESVVSDLQVNPNQVQVEEEVEEEVEEIFTFVEDPSEPIGGMPAFYKYISDNLKYPSIAKDLAIEGRVIVQFVIEKNGSLTNIEVLRGIGGGCDEEAVRVISEARAWKPAKQRGKFVKQRKVIPIVFKVKSGKKRH